VTSRSRNYPYLRAVGAGIVTGMRTATAGAAITVAVRRGLLDAGPGRLGRLLRWTPTLPLTILAAGGEIAVDKLPITPSRLDPGPLGGRIVVGAVTGAIVARGRGGSAATGAVVGSLAALASSWAFYHARAGLGSVTGLPDAVVAGGEDALALSIALAMVADWPGAGARP
jgi:uncharacterized membrane protein